GAASLALAAFARAGAAGAQPSPPPPAAAGRPAPEHVLVPPKPLGPLAAPYPPGVHGDADVVLELAVDPTGRVASARGVSGDEPFVAAAVAASSGWSFAPATRDGAPIAARIRAAIHFHEELVPTPEPEAKPAPEAAPAAPGPPPKPPPPLEVNVLGQQPPGSQSMTRAEVRLLPGAFGDPFRAIDALPGVTPIASGIPYFYVRGAPPGNVGYFLDGIRVPLLFHLGLGPSVIHPALVDRVDFFEGGYPAEYGRYAGAVVSGTTKPPAPELHGEGNVRVVDAGAMVEAPFDGGRGTALVGGRYGYTTLLLRLIAPDTNLSYWDYQTRATYDVTPRDRVSAFAFGSYDHWATRDSNGKFQTLFDVTFHRLDLGYERALGGGATLRHDVTLGYDVTGLAEGRSVVDRMIDSRTSVVRPLSPDVDVRFGADMLFDAIANDLTRRGDDHMQKGFNALFPSRDDLSVGLRADAVIRLGSRLEITPGLRVDLYASGGNGDVGIDPRLATRLAITRWLRLVQADGLASQPPSFFLPGPALQPALVGGLQRSFQTSAGVETDLPWEVSTTVTVFRNAFFNMTDALGTQPNVGTHVPQ
ncbi:MAG TPA: energy transducer TonB, partial [Minicystis sp.]|nr:energy transducer TonB [Minicystis sp.]